MQLFYCSSISSVITLDREDSKHLIKVLRKTVGDQVNIMDGKGCMALAEISDPNPKKCELKVLESEQDYEKRNYELHIAIAPTKNMNRIEWFAEKSTEIGIDSIAPIICHHSERKHIKEERLEKIVLSAAKQSLKAYVPTIHPSTSFSQYLKTVTGERYIAHCEPGEKIHLKSVVSDSITLLIGPEGDFSTKEIEMAIDAGWKPINLGDSRLRTETAGVVATTIFNTIHA